MQIAATFRIILVVNRPVTDPHEALWRFFGTVVGALALFGVFQVVAPDYAGRQPVSRFADLLRLLLGAHPPLGEPPPSAARARTLGDQIAAGLADVLRLAEEARYEGSAGGVDRDAAVQAAGILRRIVHRLVLTRRARRGERPDLAAPCAVFVAAAAAPRHAPDWPRESLEALMAEVDHLRRVTELLPQLEEQLERAILP